jgi:uncharacterized protein
MRLGVTSDTHSFELPRQMLDEFKKVDLIVHAGDFCTLEDVNKFKKLGTLRAVHGNADDSSVSAALPKQLVFDCEDLKIGLYHGHGSRHDIVKTVMAAFKTKPDIVIFGHSHLPKNERINDTLYFNPGSPNDTLTAPYCSYGIIEIKGTKVDARIVKVT